MRVVVTGAAGFIGSHVAEAIAASGHEVVALDALARAAAPEAARANWDPLATRPGVTRLDCDLVTGDLDRIAQADLIVHLAGRPGVRSSWGPGTVATERDNVTATRRLLAACAARPAGRRPHLVVASSSSVYGPAHHRPHRESDPPAPASPYAVSKVAVERLTQRAAADGVPAVILRYFSVYGPRQRPDMGFHRFVEAALDHRPIPVLGDGRQTLAFTHVSDVVAATLAAAEAATTGTLAPGTVLNVAHPEPVTVRSAVDLLAGLLGVRPRVRHRDPAAGDVRHTWGDTARAARLLGWTARIGPAEGLADQIVWHRSRRARLGERDLGNGAA